VLLSAKNPLKPSWAAEKSASRKKEEAYDFDMSSMHGQPPFYMKKVYSTACFCVPVILLDVFHRLRNHEEEPNGAGYDPAPF